jgi:hypothetical protein
MTTTTRITTTAAAVLSLAAAGAPTATATVSTNRAPTANQTPSSVYSRPDKSMVSATNPATTANQAPASVYSRPDKSMIHVSTTGGVPQAVVRIQAPPSGFDWGDAGIGAAGGLALAMIGLGGALAASQRRPRGNRQTTPLS